jgi:uncharacterized protein YjbI with pentapeptide repeats
MTADGLHAPWIKPLNLDGLFKTPAVPETGEDYEDQDFELGHLDALETRKCRFFECRIGMTTAVEWTAANSSLRNVLIEAGRIGSWDLTGVTANVVTVRGVRVGHLNLVNSKLTDVLFEDCRFDTLDLFGTALKRVKFVNCTVEELDIRNMECEHLDLRGLAFSGVRGLTALRGATISEVQLMQISSELARGAGIFVE